MVFSVARHFMWIQSPTTTGQFLPILSIFAMLSSIVAVGFRWRPQWMLAEGTFHTQFICFQLVSFSFKCFVHRSWFQRYFFKREIAFALKFFAAFDTFTVVVITVKCYRRRQSIFIFILALFGRRRFQIIDIDTDRFIFHQWHIANETITIDFNKVRHFFLHSVIEIRISGHINCLVELVEIRQLGPALYANKFR